MQATAFVDMTRQSASGNVATKGDIVGLNAELKGDIAGLKGDIAGLKTDIARMEAHIMAGIIGSYGHHNCRNGHQRCRIKHHTWEIRVK